MLHLLESMTSKREPLYNLNMTIVTCQMSQASLNTRKQPFPTSQDLLPKHFRRNSLPQCCSVLGSQDKNVPCSPFLQLKDRGNLYKPSQSVITVCTETEKCFQRMLKTSGGKLPHDKGIVVAIAITVLAAVNV